MCKLENNQEETADSVLCCQSDELWPWNKCFLCPAASVGLCSVRSQSAVLVNSCRFSSVGWSECILQSHGFSAAGLNNWVRLFQFCVQQLCPSTWRSCCYINPIQWWAVTHPTCGIRANALGVWVYDFGLDGCDCVCAHEDCAEVRKSTRNCIL